MKKSHHSAIIKGPRQVRLEKSASPRPGPAEVRMRLEGCGVCCSSFPVWEGRPWFSYPLEPGAPGHEGWGIVEEVGDGVDGPAAGSRVAMLSYHTFSEVETIDATRVVTLPRQLDGLPFPGEALGCVMNILRRSDLLPGQHVAIIGMGFLGCLLAQQAAAAGSIVIAISRGLPRWKWPLTWVRPTWCR